MQLHKFYQNLEKTLSPIVRVTQARRFWNKRIIFCFLQNARKKDRRIFQGILQPSSFFYFFYLLTKIYCMKWSQLQVCYPPEVNNNPCFFERTINYESSHVFTSLILALLNSFLIHLLSLVQYTIKVNIKFWNMLVTKMFFQNPGPSQQFNSHGNDIFS